MRCSGREQKTCKFAGFWLCVVKVGFKEKQGWPSTHLGTHQGSTNRQQSKMGVATKTKAASRPLAHKPARARPKQTTPVAAAKRGEVALRPWRRQKGLSRQTFAQLSHVSERSLASYEKAAQVPAAAQPQVAEARRLVEALLELIPAAELKAWLQSPNPGFGGRTPQELNASGERDLLWEMIYQSRLGAFA